MSIYVNRQEKVVYSGDYDGTIKKWSLDGLNLIKSWRGHPEGCPVYSLVGDGTFMFSSSCEGEIKQWSEKDCEFQQMTIVTVRFCLIRSGLLSALSVLKVFGTYK